MNYHRNSLPSPAAAVVTRENRHAISPLSLSTSAPEADRWCDVSPDCIYEATFQVIGPRHARVAGDTYIVVNACADHYYAAYSDLGPGASFQAIESDTYPPGVL